MQLILRTSITAESDGHVACGRTTCQRTDDSRSDEAYALLGNRFAPRKTVCHRSTVDPRNSGLLSRRPTATP